MKKKRKYQSRDTLTPVFYKNTNFDSLLHARWAAFFDLLGMEWLYKPDCQDAYLDWQPDFVVDTPVIQAATDEWISVHCFCYICSEQDLSQLPQNAAKKMMKAHPYNHELEELSSLLKNAPTGFKITSCAYDRVLILGDKADFDVPANQYFYRTKFKTINDIEVTAIDVGGERDADLSSVAWFSAAFHADARIWMPIDFSYGSQTRVTHWMNALKLLP
ncbi:hypothetical protein H6G76_35760 [Nostoc sp. FACHB-152]|uniref:hypothetical protein n=1 Tax=Nostoc sp. FACHB-152 TaxID=2692837 RepID=UPI001683AC0A|nr:hypothetical protein [Nostoc sp. FACHB-152]MBD2452366.1 hypothetical protein [Nostoc sp. FACHB-152]